MSSFSRIIRFACSESNGVYFAELGANDNDPPPKDSQVRAHRSVSDLIAGNCSETVTLSHLLAPLPRDDIPIYCVGLNYKSHAKEASLNIPKNPPLWTKPSASLANPEEDIYMSAFCAQSLPDYEGELVFVTSRECKNVSVAEAESYILGYTIGNDLSCRLHQMPEQMGGQFYFSKAFDKFAPIGPALVSPEIFKKEVTKITTKVNGNIMQREEFAKDMIFSPSRILSHMSKSTTIPAGTAVMTGTPAGVGAFRTPKKFLNHGDIVEIEIPKIGVLRNRILFQ